MIRATTGGVLRSYRTNLMNSFISQNKARETMLTQRTFNSYAEDPAAAAKAFRLRKSRMDVESQGKICDDTYKKFSTAWSCLDSVDKLIDTKNGEALNTLKGMTQELLNDPTGDARVQLAKALDQVSQTIVQTMNQKYGDNFIFAGADGHNVPFEVVDNKLYYRGVSVDAAEPKLFDDNGAQVTLNANGEFDTAGTNILLAGAKTISKADYDQAVLNYQNDPTGTPPPELLRDPPVAPATVGNFHEFTDANGDTYYIQKDGAETMTQAEIDNATEEAAKLKYLVNEKYFVDIGLGFQENENGNLIESSGFNAALNGLTFLGCGLDEDGDPKNIYSLVQKMREVAESVPEAGQWSDDVYEEFRGLVLKFEDASSNFKTEYTNMDAGTTKLKNNYALLEDNFDNLVEQCSTLEDVDMADAITSFIWAQYCYNAALKVGNSILSESLMDYLS